MLQLTQTLTLVLTLARRPPHGSPPGGSLWADQQAGVGGGATLSSLLGAGVSRSCPAAALSRVYLVWEARNHSSSGVAAAAGPEPAVAVASPAAAGTAAGPAATRGQRPLEGKGHADAAIAGASEGKDGVQGQGRGAADADAPDSHDSGGSHDSSRPEPLPAPERLAWGYLSLPYRPHLPTSQAARAAAAQPTADSLHHAHGPAWLRMGVYDTLRSQPDALSALKIPSADSSLDTQAGLPRCRVLSSSAASVDGGGGVGSTGASWKAGQEAMGGRVCPRWQVQRYLTGTGTHHGDLVLELHRNRETSASQGPIQGGAGCRGEGDEPGLGSEGSSGAGQGDRGSSAEPGNNSSSAGRSNSSSGGGRSNSSSGGGAGPCGAEEVCVYQLVPWYMRLWLHTLELRLNGQVSVCGCSRGRVHMHTAAAEGRLSG